MTGGYILSTCTADCCSEGISGTRRRKGTPAVLRARAGTGTGKRFRNRPSFGEGFDSRGWGRGGRSVPGCSITTLVRGLIGSTNCAARETFKRVVGSGKVARCEKNDCDGGGTWAKEPGWGRRRDYAFRPARV